MPLIIQAAEDKSWRVRLCLSKNFTEIAANFGKEVTDMSLIQTYGNLLKDSEVDVKIEAVKSLSNFVKIVSPEKMSYLLPQVTALGKDSMAIVRGTARTHSLANVGIIIKNMIQSVSKDQAYQNIQPLIKELMKDDNQEVRKGGIEAATKFIEVLGADTITSLSPSLKACSEDLKWRVRLELIKHVTDLAIKMQVSPTLSDSPSTCSASTWSPSSSST